VKHYFEFDAKTTSINSKNIMNVKRVDFDNINIWNIRLYHFIILNLYKFNLFEKSLFYRRITKTKSLTSNWC